MGYPKTETLEELNKKRRTGINGQMATGLTLAGVTAVNYAAREFGFTDQLESDDIKNVLGSMCHPFLGWLGACAANRLPGDSKRAKIIKVGISVVSALVINETIEIGKDAAPILNEEPAGAPSDDGQDKLYALGGVGVYYTTDMLLNLNRPKD